MQTADAGYGLAGMKERLLLIGGTLHAGPETEPGGGPGFGPSFGPSGGSGGAMWVVHAELPHIQPATPATTEGREDRQ
jgi:hypothetical protein